MIEIGGLTVTDANVPMRVREIALGRHPPKLKPTSETGPLYRVVVLGYRAVNCAICGARSDRNLQFHNSIPMDRLAPQPLHVIPTHLISPIFSTGRESWCRT